MARPYDPVAQFARNAPYLGILLWVTSMIVWTRSPMAAGLMALVVLLAAPFVLLAAVRA